MAPKQRRDGGLVVKHEGVGHVYYRDSALASRPDRIIVSMAPLYGRQKKQFYYHLDL